MREPEALGRREVLPDDRFLCSRAEFAAWAEGRKRLVMEDFYRVMRRRTGLLMDGDQPAGGQWNFDADNRKGPVKGMRYPPLPRFAPDAVTEEVLALVEARFGNHFGDLRPFGHAVTRAQALGALDDFIAQRLPQFGDYQDAMVAGEDGLFHSHVSAQINAGLLSALEVCEAAEARLPRRQGADQCRRGLHPADPRLAGICARHPLDCRAGLHASATISARRATCPISTGPARPTCAACPKPSAPRSAMPMPITSSG